MKTTWSYKVQFKNGDIEPDTVQATTRADAEQKIRADYKPYRVRIIHLEKVK